MVKIAKKFFTVSVVAMTIMWSVGLVALVPTVALAVDACPELEAGDLYKVPGLTAVYLINADMDSVYFPSSEVYHTWYTDFSGVEEIPNTCIDAYPLAGGVNYRPGSMLVKRDTSPSVFVVEPGNVKTKIGSEEVAVALYGATWASKVRDIASVYWLNFTSEGSEIETIALHNGMNVTVDGDTVYAVIDGMRYEVDGETDAVQTVSQDLLDSLEMGTGTVTAASLKANAAQTSAGAADDTTDDTTDDVVVAGDLTASLSANTPAGATVARGSINVDVLKFNVKAGASAVTLDEMTVKRGGVGAVTGLKVYLYDGNTRKGSGKTFSSDTNEADFSVLGIEIPANTTKELTLRLESSASSAGEHDFSVTVLTATNVTISGLPVTSNKFSVTAPTAGTIVADGTGTLSNPTIGDANAQLAQFSLVTASEDAMLYSFTLKQDGTIDTGLLSNLTLKDGSTDVPVTVSVDGRLVTFVLDTPLKLVDGSTKTFKVYGDISADTDVGKTIVFYMQYTTDVKAVGSSYGFGVLPTILLYDASGDSNTLTLAGGGLTIANLSDTAHDVKVDSTEVVLGKISLKAVSDTMEIQKMTATIDTTKATTGGVDYGTYKDLDSDADYGTGDTLLLRNIKLKDADTGKTLGSAKAITDAVAITDGNATSYAVWAATMDVDVNLAFQWTDYFTVKKGETRNIILVADINSAQASAVVHLASFDMSSANFTVKDSADNTVTDIVPAVKIASNNITTRTTSLTISRASSPESRTIVKGSTVDSLGMIWAAGSGAGNDVKISALVVDVYVNASSTEANFALNTETEVVATAANALITSASLYVGDTLIAGPVSPDSNGRLQFTSAKFVGGYYTVPAGTSKNVIIKTVVSGNAPYGSVDDSFAYTFVAADVTAEDVNGTSLTTSVTGTNLNGTTAPTVAITITSAGTITTAADSGKPDAAIVIAGLATEQEVHRIRLTATKEAWVVDEMTVNASPSTAYDNVQYVQLYSLDGTQLGPDGGLGLDSSGNANFTGLSIGVAKTGNTIVVVKAKLKAIDERTTATDGTAGVDADSGDYLEFRLETTSANFNATSASGASDAAADAAVGNTMVVRKTKPTVAIMALPSTSLSSAEKTIMKFSVTADANGDVILGGVKPYITFNDADGATAWLTMTSGTLTIYDVTGSETELTATAKADAGYVAASTSQQYDLPFDTAKVVTIAAGTTRTFEIRATFSGVEASDSIETKLVRDTLPLTGITETLINAVADASDDFVWSDVSADGVTTSVEYTNGYLLQIPTTISSISKSS